MVIYIDGLEVGNVCTVILTLQFPCIQYHMPMAPILGKKQPLDTDELKHNPGTKHHGEWESGGRVNLESSSLGRHATRQYVAEGNIKYEACKCDSLNACLT